MMGDLARLLSPEVIAVIGASEREGTLGRRILENLLGATGRRIYPVNPGKERTLGRDCCPTVRDIPEPVDMAVIATPAPLVPAIVKECGQAGVQGLVIISAGFRESGPDGERREDEIRALQRRFGMRIIGPNCLGVIRPGIELNASFLKDTPPPGKLAFLAHAHGFGRSLLDWALSAHVGFSTVVSLGSAIDVDLGDLIDYLGNDAQTRSIILYLEDQLGQPRKLVSAIRGFARTKPIIILKPPLLEIGAENGRSHTAILADPDRVCDAVIRRTGAVRVKEAQDLFNAAAVLCSAYQPKGPRLAIMGNARGVGLMAANRLLRSGGQLALLTPETQRGLAGVLPAHVSRDNPLPLQRNADVGRYEQALTLLQADPQVDGVLVIYTPQEAARDEELAEVLVPLAQSVRKPVITTWLGGQGVRLGRDRMGKAGVPAYETAEEAVRTYLYMYEYERNLELLHETPSELSIDDAPPKHHLKTLIRNVRRKGVSVLTEDDAMKFIRNYGIPLVDTQLVASPEEAVEIARRVGYPVVLKIVSPDVIYRQDVGGVVTGVDSDEKLRKEYGKLLQRFRARAPHAEIRGIAVQKMVELIDYEIILGARRDPTFGAIILFGMGGVGVEIFRDFSLGLPPLNQSLARRLMEDTNVYRMLQGYRGKTPADLRQIEGLIVSFSNLVVDFPEIGEIDINPVAVSDGHARVLDARIILTDEPLPDAGAPYPHLVITPYPTRYVANWSLSDRTPIVLRPIRPEDEPLEQDMFQTLSEESLRGRFYQTIRTISHDLHVKFCNIDYEREMSIVAELREGERRRLIGIGSLISETVAARGEFAILVHDDFQGKGLAYKLLDTLVGIAVEKGLKEFYGIIERRNRKMVSLCRKMGMVEEPLPDGLIRVRLVL
ncbi:MAG TPA: bifunctional acetate--CoA ligase family protein/GNAT family N-acetyltransferase [Syntrophales bacterium]|nr:bifunctional acetate--CoA ligase family protein/GNAT family N-acetyltransferase [Syntrophales bacterium]